MTPKEKAKQLFKKQYQLIWSIDLGINVDKDAERYEAAKQCALIVADEAIDQWEYIDIYISDLGGELNTNLRYWYEVKEEIIRL